MEIAEIISGGQTGADRPALDVTIRHGFPHSGLYPKVRRAEDGLIGGQYRRVITVVWAYGVVTAILRAAAELRPQSVMSGGCLPASLGVDMHDHATLEWRKVR